MITDHLLEGSPMKLKKLVALVTGASSGIGKATAERLATAGYQVYGTSRRGATPGQRSFEMLSLDVTSDESVAAAVNALLRSEGRVDLLVNNAGFSVAPAGAEESSIEQARANFDANLLEPDAKLDEYREARAAVSRQLSAVLETADEPGVVADVVLEAARAARPKLRYTAGGLATRLRLLRRFAPAGALDAGIRRNLRLDAPVASPHRASVLA